MKRAARKSSASHVAEICLYGTRETGAGWLAATPDGQRFGDGETKKERTFTDAIFLALCALQAAGVRSGTCRVYDAGGERFAAFRIGFSFCYGALDWQPAFGVSVSAAEIIAAAQ